MSRYITEYMGPKDMMSKEDLEWMEDTCCYVIEEKYDGWWMLFDNTSGAAKTLSRVGTELDLSQWDFAWNPDCKCKVVGEWMRGKYVLFDILYWDGYDHTDSEYNIRRKYLHEFVKEHGTDLVTISNQWQDNFAQHYEEVLARGGEGVVVKDTISSYDLDNDKTCQWIKVKPLRTIDYVVIGTKTAANGRGQAKLGLYKDGNLAYIQTVYIPKGLDVIAGDVVEVQGMEIYHTGSIRHGQIKDVRHDKVPGDCTLEAALRSG